MLSFSGGSGFATEAAEGVVEAEAARCRDGVDVTCLVDIGGSGGGGGGTSPWLAPANLSTPDTPEAAPAAAATEAGDAAAVGTGDGADWLEELDSTTGVSGLRTAAGDTAGRLHAAGAGPEESGTSPHSDTRRRFTGGLKARGGGGW